MEEEKLERVLSGIEFPGEDENDIRGYLDQAGIPEKVLRTLQAAVFRRNRMRNWGLVSAAALFILLVLGANEYVTEFLFFLQSAITMFLAILFAALFMVGLLGFFLNVDYSRIAKTFNRHEIEDFLTSLFHSR